MATVKELEEKLRALEARLASYGFETEAPSTRKVEDRADFIAPGSDKHAVFLGLVPAEPGDDERITYTSPGTGKTYALEDEIMQFLHYPNPEQAAMSTLRQKVNVLETKAEVPEDAPPLWRPRDF